MAVISSLPASIIQVWAFEFKSQIFQNRFYYSHVQATIPLVQQAITRFESLSTQNVIQKIVTSRGSSPRNITSKMNQFTTNENNSPERFDLFLFWLWKEWLVCRNAQIFHELKTRVI
jgi:hypothetical protein